MYEILQGPGRPVRDPMALPVQKNAARNKVPDGIVLAYGAVGMMASRIRWVGPGGRANCKYK